jgi:hypothetical protein
MANLSMKSLGFIAALLFLPALAVAQDSASAIGREVAIPAHLEDGDEFNISLRRLIQYGAQLFNAKFTIQEGAGRPLSKGTGAPPFGSKLSLAVPSEFRSHLFARSKLLCRLSQCARVRRGWRPRDGGLRARAAL